MMVQYAMILKGLQQGLIGQLQCPLPACAKLTDWLLS